MEPAPALCRCGSRTVVPSGERRAPWSPRPPRPGPRVVRVGTARPRRTRTMSTTSRWTRTRTTRRSACYCASTGLPSRCLAWARTASDPGPAAQAGLPLPFFPCSQLRVGDREEERRGRRRKRGGKRKRRMKREGWKGRRGIDGECIKRGDWHSFLPCLPSGPLARSALRESEQAFVFSREPGCGLSRCIAFPPRNSWLGSQQLLRPVSGCDCRAKDGV